MSEHSGRAEVAGGGHERSGGVTTGRALWLRRKDHLAAGISCMPEIGAGPDSFAASALTPQVVASDTACELLAITFPDTVPGGVPRFFRVRVVIPHPD